jgi:hypothetical protein
MFRKGVRGIPTNYQGSFGAPLWSCSFAAPRELLVKERPVRALLSVSVSTLVL